MADVTISGLSPAASVSLSDILPISNGSITNKAAVSQVLSLLNNSYLIDYLIVAGGGSGGNHAYSGGGGAGGVIYGTTYIDPGKRYPLVVGAGAIATTYVAGNGELSYDGEDSYFLGARAIGGGGGGSGSNASFQRGRFGGSGGGSSGYKTSITNQDQPYYSDYVIGQGHGGAIGSSYGAGGGGGAGGFGFKGTAANGGAGGPGFTWFNGVTYGGGGGGAAYTGTGGLGGAGGGGNGANNNNAPTSGAANTGGGGGGASGYTGVVANYTGGNGGSGVVIVRYFSDTQKGSGGTVTSAGGYFYHTFTSTGNSVYIG